jgi:hypothetical protein
MILQLEEKVFQISAYVKPGCRGKEWG